MVKLATDQLSKLFLVDINSWQDTDPFDFVSRDSDTLLVTIGDSWTWGADLTLDNNDESRLRYVYGNQVSEFINSDWLNIGQRGTSNFWIYHNIRRLAQLIPELTYKKIIVVCMFTESARSINSHYDTDIDYINWFAHNINSKQDFYKLLEYSNSIMVERINKLVESYHHVRLIYGTNMVDPIGLDQAKMLLPPWFKLITNKYNINIPRKPIYIRHNGPVKSLHTMMDLMPDEYHPAYLEWLTDLIEQSIEMDKVFENKLLFSDSHPFSDGHTLIATEIVKEIQSW